MPTQTRSRSIAEPQPTIQALEGFLAHRWNALLAWVEARAGALRIESNGRWRVIPSREGSMSRLAGERVTVRLSTDQANVRRAAKQLADQDPAAYLQACRDGKL